MYKTIYRLQQSIYKLNYLSMNDCDQITITPIYHENVIHISDAIPINDQEVFAIASELDSGESLHKCNIINKAKQWLGCMCLILTVWIFLFILFGGIEIFVPIDD